MTHDLTTRASAKISHGHVNQPVVKASTIIHSRMVWKSSDRLADFGLFRSRISAFTWNTVPTK